MQVFPEPTVGGLIFNQENKLFLMKSHKWKGALVVPGGHIELGEKIEEALIREVKEETNLDVYDLRFICFQEFLYGNSFWKKKHFLFFYYACKTKTTDVILNHEAQEYRWVDPAEAENLPVEAYTQYAITEYLKKLCQ